MSGSEQDLHQTADWDFEVPEREAIRALVAERRELDEREIKLVDAARRLAIPWRSIAGDLGISTTAAYRRHARHDPLAAQRRERRAELEHLLGPSNAS